MDACCCESRDGSLDRGGVAASAKQARQDITKNDVISHVHTTKATEACTIRLSIQALALEVSGRALSRPGV